jgi:hypothetical protein
MIDALEEFSTGTLAALMRHVEEHCCSTLVDAMRNISPSGQHHHRQIGGLE